jgi:hypothetical protein
MKFAVFGIKFTGVYLMGIIGIYLNKHPQAMTFSDEPFLAEFLDGPP